jgi:hypothetical protein
MATILEKSIFVHVPKTGGTWIQSAIKNSCQNIEITGPNLKSGWNTVHSSYREIKQHFDFKDKPVFCFVRNPVHWWQSRWSDPFHRMHYKQKKNCFNTTWCGNVQWLNYETFMETPEQFQDFNVYMRSVLERRPNFFSDYFHFMANAVDIKVGKFENITTDLIYILREYREVFNEKALRTTPIINESDPKLKDRRRYQKDVLAAVIESEKKLMEEYDYSTKLEDYEGIIWN